MEKQICKVLRETDEQYMKKALELARQSAAMGEVPVGAVIVRDGEILCGAHNRRETDKDASAHAELIAIREACDLLGGWRLTGCTLYVTLEPCPMCAGALVNARVDRVVYGVKDAAAGCCGSVLNLNAYPFNHAFAVTGGVCEQECRELLRDFFKQRRNP